MGQADILTNISHKYCDIINSAKRCETFLEGRNKIPSRDSSLLHELPERGLKNEDRDATEKEKRKVGNKKCTAAVFVAKIREAPNISCFELTNRINTHR